MRSEAPLAFRSQDPRSSESHPIEIQIAVRYWGASVCRTIKDPAIPPSPLKAVVVAAETTRFHWL